MADTVDLKRRGFMLVLSSPSGAGKSSIARQLIARSASAWRLSISVTTRQRRPSEIEGVHYHFIDARQFGRMRDAGDLLEWAEVHGNLYATPAAPVEEALAAGKDVLFDIDWQGAAQIAKARREDVVLVFILPPTMAELRSRLERRAEDKRRRDPATAPQCPRRDRSLGRVRLRRGQRGSRAIADALSARSSIAERHKRIRQRGLADFVGRLQAEQ